MNPTEKTCPLCHRTLPRSAFYPRGYTSDGRRYGASSRCKSCFDNITKRNHKARRTLVAFHRQHPSLPLRCALGTGPAVHADHIIPLSRGGSDELDNLRWLCAYHNLARNNGHRSDAQLRRFPCNADRSFALATE
jgi:hypothetical protein